MPDDIDQQSFSIRRRWVLGLNAFLGLVALVAVVVMLNYVSGGHFMRWQWATHSQLRLSPQTIRVLDAITNDVTATIFFDPQEEQELYSLTSSLLDEYHNANKKHLTVRTLNPKLFPADAKQLLAKHNLTGLKEPNFVLLESGGRSKIYYAKNLASFNVNALLAGEKNVRRESFSGEMLFTSGIFALGFPRQMKAAFLIGHGEHDPENTANEDGCSKLAAILKDEINCDWQPVSLLGTNALDCQLLIIAGPRKTGLSQVELEKLDNYLAQGGRLLALIDSRRADPGLEQLLAKKWGIGVSHSPVVETDKNYLLNGPSDFVTAKLVPHPITNPLIFEKLPIRFISPRPVFRWPDAPRGPDAPEIKMLAGTTEKASDGQTNGSFPLIVAVEQGVIKGVSAPKVGTRIVVTGDSEMLSDKIIDTEANHYFAGNALNWLLDRPDLIVRGLTPKPITEYKLFVTQSQLKILQWIFLAGLPSCALMIGGLVWLRRRK